MSRSQDSRALAERVEQGFQRRANWFRRWNWIAGVALSGVVTAWVVSSIGSGRHGRMAAAPLSNAHQMFENDCQRCHVPWSLARRLNPAEGEVWSVSNEKCQSCHAGPAHHARQDPAHEQISCARCHREHRGHEQLAQVAQQLCLECHANLNEHVRRGAAATGLKFAAQIDRFDGVPGAGLHPPFKLHELLRAPEPFAAAITRNDLPLEWRLVEAPGNAGRTAARYVDQGRLRFNHQKHLHARYENGQLVEGLLNADRQLIDFSDNCQACHQPEADGALMQPINYEAHCRSCHPLHFDREFPDERLPHGVQPDVVRGYLMSFYARRTEPGRGNGPNAASNADPDVVRPRLLEPELLELELKVKEIETRLPIPDKIERAERDALALEARRGCQYCHEVTGRSESKPAQVEQTRVPRRWFTHARFRHGSHRMIDCRQCHRDFLDDPKGRPVAESANTSDVLIPTIDVCRNCHAEKPPSQMGAWGAPILNPAGTLCVECHAYHQRPAAAGDLTFRGRFNLRLEPETVGSKSGSGVAGAAPQTDAGPTKRSRELSEESPEPQ